ncbi:class I SAM-dependent methyltransferase [Bacteroidota bacterium]
MKDFWDKRYTSYKNAYGCNPNSFLKNILKKENPGRLLLPGEGEGRNAVYAALKGWDVDAIDFSTVARNHALKCAEDNEVKINYFIDRVENFKPVYKYDLIAVIFVHLEAPERRLFHKQIPAWLESGGKLIMESFSMKQLENCSGGPRNPNMLYEVETLKDDFKSLQIELLQEEEVLLNEGNFHHGESKVIRLIATKK